MRVPALLLATCLSAAAQTECVETKLENGLTLLVQEDHAAPVATVSVWYRVGSRNERPGQTGMSHLIEHMMFKGTPTHGKGEYSRTIKRNGGEYNAVTSFDFTAYYEVLASDRLDVAFELEADRMANLLFDPGEFEAEREVVKEERRTRIDDQPFGQAVESLFATAFQAHPYHWPTIGWRSDLDRVTRDECYAYYKRHYVPNNATVLVVGDVDPKEVEEKVRATFGAILKGEKVPHVEITEPEQRGERRFKIRRETQVTGVGLGWHVPNSAHEDGAAITVLQTILSNGESARIPKALMKDKQTALIAICLYQGDMIDPSLFIAFGVARPDKKAEDVERGILEEVQRIQDEPPTAKELERARNQIVAGRQFGAESSQALAIQLGTYQMVQGWDLGDRLLERIASVTAEDVQRVAKKYLTEDNRTVGTLVLPAAQAPKLAPPRGTGAAISPSDIKRVRLENGLTILVVERHGHPTVSLGALVRAGSAWDLPGKEGAASLTASAAVRGTPTRTPDAIDEAVDFVGGSWTASCDPDGATLTGKFLSKDLDLGLDLLTDSLRNASFPEKEVERLRGLVFGGIKAAKDQPSDVARKEFERIVYDGHPYGHASEGTEASIGMIERDDLVNFHRNLYAPNFTTIVIVGDVAAEEVVARLTKALGDWHTKEGPPGMASEAKPGDGIRLRIVDKPLEQATLVVGHRAVPRSHPDYYALKLMNDILGGGGLYNRLANDIRDKNGLAYSVGSAFRHRAQAGAFHVELQTKVASARQALGLVLEHLRRIREEGVTEGELEESRAYFLGSFPLAFETNAELVTQLLTIEAHGLGVEYLSEYAERMKAVTKADVDRVAKEHLRPEELVLVMVGDRAKTNLEVAGLGKVTEVEEARTTVPHVDPEPEAVAEVDRAIEAQGGAALLGMKDLTVDADTLLSSPMGQMQAKITLRIKRPNKWLADVAMGPMKVKQGFDGSKFWFEAMGTVKEVQGGDAMNVGGVGLLCPLLEMKEKETSFTTRRDGELDGRPAVLVDAHKEDGTVQTLYLDSETHLLLKSEGVQVTPQGKARVETFFRDYKAYGAITVPSHVEGLSDGKKSQEFKVADVKLDTGLEDSLFTMPEGKAPVKPPKENR